MAENPVPGTIVAKGPFKFLVCPILNDPETNVLIPQVTAESVKAMTKLTPVWPLGIYLVFLDEGITMGIFGSDPEGKLGHGSSDLPLAEEGAPEGLVHIWDLWKKYRDTPEEVIVGNLERLVTLSEAQFRGAS
jgi:hypothetical protein